MLFLRQYFIFSYVSSTFTNQAKLILFIALDAEFSAVINLKVFLYYDREAGNYERMILPAKVSPVFESII